VCRKWELNRVQDLSIAPFEDWVSGAIADNDLDANNPDDIHRLLLSTKPSQRAFRYMRMKAFGNHFRVEDIASTTM
jgi:hypothetical protein